jgi:transposase
VDQAKKDAADRETILKSLEKNLKNGDKSLVGNNGYRKFLENPPETHFSIDEEKVKEEARLDGKWVLRTNTQLTAEEVALKYKQLWTVEDLFRSIKSLLETRPIYHKRDETIRGHVFCSFLALVLRKELQDRLESRGFSLEWADIISDLDELAQMDIIQDGKHFILRTESKGCCGKVFQAAGVAMPPTVRALPPPPIKNERGTRVVPTIS